MQALIPFKPSNAKSRLAPLLSQSERIELAYAMLQDVVDAVKSSGIKEYFLVATEHVDGYPTIVSPHGLNEALNSILEEESRPTIIVMSDLPLIKSKHIDEIAVGNGVTIAPGRGGGTNILFMKDPRLFEVRYYGSSFKAHLNLAEERGLPVRVYDSFYTSTDIDEPQDLVELLIHGNGQAHRCLESWGFKLATENGRVSIKRK